MRAGRVFYKTHFVGRIVEEDDGTYSFQYDQKYLSRKDPAAVSLTLPLRSEPFRARQMFPFFDGLIPEGWLLNLVVRNWKLDHRDRLGLLLEACRDCIGAVHIEPEGE